MLTELFKNAKVTADTKDVPSITYATAGLFGVIFLFVLASMAILSRAARRT